MNDLISEVSTPENESDVDRRGMRKFFSRAGAVFLLLMVGLLLAMVGQHSDVLFYGGGAIMCSAILLGLAFMYESLEPHERLNMRLGMYAAVGFFASLCLLKNVNFSSLTLMAILVAPLMILSPIDLLCCHFAQRTAAGLSQGGGLAEPPLAPAATDLAAPAQTQTQTQGANLMVISPATSAQAGPTSFFRQVNGQKQKSSGELDVGTVEMSTKSVADPAPAPATAPEPALDVSMISNR